MLICKNTYFRTSFFSTRKSVTSKTQTTFPTPKSSFLFSIEQLGFSSRPSPSEFQFVAGFELSCEQFRESFVSQALHRDATTAAKQTLSLASSPARCACCTAQHSTLPLHFEVEFPHGCPFSPVSFSGVGRLPV